MKRGPPRDLPSGVVAFLFTDIEGSTDLFRALGDAYSDLLADHHRLMRAALARHDGIEVRTDGDAFLVAFARVGDALAAALDAQLDLASHMWPENAEVRIRMGVHVGDARVIDGDYVSFALHQGTRVAGAAHGGQVLVSTAAAGLAEGTLPRSASLEDLGAHDLRDFGSPEHLYQLRHPDLPATFPPLRVRSTHTGDDPAAPLRLADDAMSVGDVEGAVAHLSAAVRGLTAAGQPRPAAMACVRLGDVFNGMGNKVAARPWFTRAVRLVEHEPPCLEQGYAALAPHGCDVDDPAELVARAELALDRARRFGDVDLETKALADGGLARVQAGRVADGMAMMDEALALACGGGTTDAGVMSKSICSFFTACYFTADFERMEVWSRVLRQRGILGSAPGPQAFLSSHCSSVQGTLLCFLGRWGEADDVLTRAHADIEEAMPDAVWHPPIALAELRILQGRLAEAEALLLGRDHNMQALLPTARLYLARGDFDLARATARRGLRFMGDDRVRAASLLGVVVEAELGRGNVREAAAAAAEVDARTRGLGLPALEGEAARLRARVRAAQGDVATAVAALQEGLDHLAAADLPRLKASLHLDLARLCETADDRAEAVVEARAAAGLLARLDVVIASDDADLLVRLGVEATSRPVRAGCRVAHLERDGAWWTAGCGDTRVRLRDTKGLRYLAELVAHPGTERHVLDLVDIVGGVPTTGTGAHRRPLGDAGERRDAVDRAANRLRVAELRDEVEDALALEDDDRAAKAQAELDALVAELARAFGVGGRDLKAASVAERTRLNVTRALRAALARVSEAFPEPGAVLSRRVHTGLLCVYEPHPDDGIMWSAQTSSPPGRPQAARR
jgi:class 3 adenylate cyclase